MDYQRIRYVRTMPIITMVPASAPPAWTPLSLGANLMAWYEADVGVYSDAGVTPASNNDRIQQWNDQSSNAYNLTQAASVQRPVFLTAGLNSKQAVDFSSSASTFLRTAINAVNLTGLPVSIFSVIQPSTEAGDDQRYVSYVANGQTDDFSNAPSANMVSFDFNIPPGTPSRIEADRNGAFNLGTLDVQSSGTYRAGFIWNGTNVTGYLNNVAGGVDASTGTFSSGTLSFGSLTNPLTTGAQAFANGMLSEVIIANIALTSTMRDSINTYFGTKWGF